MPCGSAYAGHRVGARSFYAYIHVALHSLCCDRRERMRGLWFSILCALALPLTSGPAGAQTGSRRDLEGVWTNGTVTPLQRPAEFAGRTTLTPEEARIYEAGHFDRLNNNIAN